MEKHEQYLIDNLNEILESSREDTKEAEEIRDKNAQIIHNMKLRNAELELATYRLVEAFKKRDNNVYVNEEGVGENGTNKNIS